VGRKNPNVFLTVFRSHQLFKISGNPQVIISYFRVLYDAASVWAAMER
jgi:hypothetical protein